MVAQRRPPRNDVQRTVPEMPALVPSSRPTPSTEAKFVLVVMNGAQIGERRAVDGMLRLGRDPSSDLAVRDATVSWKHAEVALEDGVLVLLDLGSQHGSWVNGTRVEKECTLREADRVQLGATELRVELHGPAELLFDRAIEARVMYDELTGLLSRRRFDAVLDGKLEAAHASGARLSLVVIDLDKLKEVNDAHGHAAGAEVIRTVGIRLRGLLPEGIAACRFGGDEFAVAIDVDEEGAVRLATQLVDAIRATVVAFGPTALAVSASAGAASVQPDVRAVADLFARADAALRVAKRGGGERVVRWSHLPPHS